MMDAFRCVRPATGDEQMVDRFPDDLVTRLADLADAEESEFESIVDRWAETDEMNCSATEARDIVEEVANLAWRARDEGKGVYVWTST